MIHMLARKKRSQDFRSIPLERSYILTDPLRRVELRRCPHTGVLLQGVYRVEVPSDGADRS